jgi:beta-galactosidase
VTYGVAYAKEDVSAGFWAEALEPEPETEVLAGYIAGPFAGAAALSCRRHGAGSALYLGWYPTPQQAEAIVADLADRAGVDRLDHLLPEGVIRACRGQSTMLLNFTEQVQHVDVSGQSPETASGPCIAVPSRDLVILA